MIAPEKTAPLAFHIMAKPTAAACNLNFATLLRQGGLAEEIMRLKALKVKGG